MTDPTKPASAKTPDVCPQCRKTHPIDHECIPWQAVPTKQAATAKTAREVIAAHISACEEWARPHSLEQLEASKFYDRVVSALARSALALRALLDAPEGGVQRLCEDVTKLIASLDFTSTVTDRITAHIAALRASPESVGGAVPSPDIERLLAAERVRTAEALRERDEARKIVEDATRALEMIQCDCRSMPSRAASILAHRNELKAERDALKTDLAAARGEVERVKADPRLTLGFGVKDPERKMLAAFLDHDEARTYWDPIRNSTFVTFGPDAVMGTKPTPAYASADLTQIARMDRIEARVAAAEKATPPPATEAPVSERARLVYEGCLRSIGPLGGNIDVIALRYREILAAAERAAQGEGGAS